VELESSIRNFASLPFPTRYTHHHHFLFRDLILLRLLPPSSWSSYVSSTRRTVFVGLWWNASLFHPLQMYFPFEVYYKMLFWSINGTVEAGYVALTWWLMPMSGKSSLRMLQPHWARFGMKRLPWMVSSVCVHTGNSKHHPTLERRGSVKR
jgi:hypothetical protein